MHGATAEQLSALPAEKADSDKESEKGEENEFSFQQHYNIIEPGSVIIILLLATTGIWKVPNVRAAPLPPLLPDLPTTRQVGIIFAITILPIFPSVRK